MRYIFILLLITTSIIARGESFLITPNSAFQELIDQTAVELFNSTQASTLCEATGNALSLSHSLGVSPAIADKIFAHCPRETLSKKISKVLQKTYYLVNEKNVEVQSWTDFGNRTYIYVDSDLDVEDFKKIITHEWAISLDAKAGFLFTIYQKYQYRQNSDIQGLDNEALRKAFNRANWAPIAQTFSMLRAFSFESLATGKNVKLTHQQCAENFLKFYPQIRKYKDYNQAQGIDFLVADLASALDRANSPKSPEEEVEVIRDLLSSNLKLKDGQNPVTFCLFMSTPLLTGNSADSFFSSGPRPRLTGGAGKTLDFQDKKISPAKDSRQEIFKIDRSEFKLDREKLLTEIIELDKNILDPKASKQSQ